MQHYQNQPVTPGFNRTFEHQYPHLVSELSELMPAIESAARRRTSSAYDADDSVQDVWVRVLQRPALFEQARLAGRLRPYVLSAVNNQSMDLHRGRARRERLSESYQRVTHVEPGHAPAAEDQAIERLAAHGGTSGSTFVDRVLDQLQLSAREQDVLISSLVHSESWDEIAARRGETAPGVRSVFYRVRTAIQEAFDPQDIRDLSEQV